MILQKAMHLGSPWVPHGTLTYLLHLLLFLWTPGCPSPTGEVKLLLILQEQKPFCALAVIYLDKQSTAHGLLLTLLAPETLGCTSWLFLGAGWGLGIVLSKEQTPQLQASLQVLLTRPMCTVSLQATRCPQLYNARHLGISNLHPLSYGSYSGEICQAALASLLFHLQKGHTKQTAPAF